MIAIAEPIDADALRARNEFLTLSDLRASTDDVALLLNVSRHHAAVILESLVHDGFLEGTAAGQFVRRAKKETSVTQPHDKK